MSDPKYAAFTALDPFFDIVQQGLASLVDGDHYFDTIVQRTNGQVIALAVYRKEDVDLPVKRCLIAQHELRRASNEVN